MGDRTDCLEAFCKLRRLQEATESGHVKCMVCGKLIKWNECDGGHYIPRQFRSTEIDPDNVWPECPSCNRFGPINHSTIYGINLVGKIGSTRVTRLQNMRDHERKEPCSVDQRDYRALANRFNREARKIRKEKGL